MTDELAKGIDAAWRLAADAAVGGTRQQLLELSLDASEWGGGSEGAFQKASQPVRIHLTAFSVTAAAAADHALGSGSGGSLLVHALAESLSSLPQLADEDDQQQVEGITRLARVLQVTVSCRCICRVCGGAAQTKECLYWVPDMN